MGWDDLEQLEESPDIRAATQQREDLARLCLRVFGTEDGLEGQRNVVRDLMARINQARNL